MKQKEIEELKLKVYTLYSKNRSKKENKLYKEVIRLIYYTERLKRTLKELSNIGSQHYL